jgi:hypothetical protein
MLGRYTEVGARPLEVLQYFDDGVNDLRRNFDCFTAVPLGIVQRDGGTVLVDDGQDAGGLWSYVSYREPDAIANG